MTLETLMQSVESISRIYAAKHGIERSSDWFLLKLHEEVGELTQAHLKDSGRARSGDVSPDELRESLAAETAGVLCHVLLYAAHHEIDIERAVSEKWLSWLGK